MDDNTLRKLIRSILSEAAVAGRNDVAKDVLAVAGSVFRKGTGDKGELRLQPVDKTSPPSPDDIRDLLRKAGHPIVKEVPKGHPDSKSSKFVTYWTSTGVPIVVASGGNQGQKFEKDIQTASLDSSEISELKKLLGLKDIVSIETGSTNASRPLGLNPRDVGASIADVVFRKKDGSAVYVSLKDPNGATFGNFGIVGAFKESPNGVVTSPHPSDVLLSALGIDKEAIADGLSDLLRGGGHGIVDTSPSYDPERARGILESGYGYGYWYARKLNKGWHVIDLTTREKLAEHVGDVRVEQVKYPGDNKQCAAWISTTTGGRYKIEIRNTKGGVIPREIKIKVLSSVKFDK